MHKWTDSRRAVWCVLAVGLLGLLVAGGVAFASIPDSNGVIHGCYRVKGGRLRVIDPAESACRQHEHALSWNQAGPTGPQGVAGPAGATGAAGPPGPAGLSSAISAHRSFGPTNAPAGPGFTTIVTEHVSPGFYVFLAKTVIITSTSTGSDCILTYDTGSGEVRADGSTQAPFDSSVTARSTHNLQRLLQFATTSATIRLECRAGTQWSASDSQIIAMQVQHASDSEVNG